MTEEERERLEKIRERWSVKTSNTKSWGEYPTLQSVGGIKGAITDIDFLLSLYDSQAAGMLLEDDRLVAEMNKVAEELVREWYCNSQHRDELVEEIAVTLTAAHRRAEANAATTMRDKCVEKVRKILKPYELEFRRRTNSATNMVDYTAMALESLTLDQVQEK